MEHATHMLAAYSELAIAIVSFYGCGAAVLNTHFEEYSYQLVNHLEYLKIIIFIYRRPSPSK